MQEPEIADVVRAGYRLHRLEVYNWGTFDDKIWGMTPGGHTVLLTGANGSGKSTLVDGLSTLLVPPGKRTYNQASGERKRERTEYSYVRGAYGRIQDADTQLGRLQYLRKNNSYSVLLAVFFNETLQQTVTLAQLFWLQGNHEVDKTPEKYYVVAPMRLSIAEHFKSLGDVKEFRRRLKALGAEVDTEFSTYSRHFRKLFNLQSDQALHLFSQIVSIKEIGGLNDFIRTNMLEKFNAREKIDELRANYDNLTSAHDAIMKAQRQLQQLEPMMTEAARYDELLANIADAERLAELVPFYFAGCRRDMLLQEIDTNQRELETDIEQEKTLIVQRDECQQDRERLFAAIQNDAIGQRLQQIDREMVHVKERGQQRYDQAQKYDKLARQLDRPGVKDERAFHDNATWSRDQLLQVEPRQQGLVDQRDNLVKRRLQVQEKLDTENNELVSLRQRKSQIPEKNITIREIILQALRLDEDDLPFIGELLKVREDAVEWEPAIERLLHGLGLQMLVPDRHYKRVARFVNDTNLRGRLVYHRVEDVRPASRSRLDPDALFHKVEVKPDSQFVDWLEAEVIERWNFVCCAGLERFSHEQYALSVTGQIKRRNQHEKDDQRPLGDRRDYVLGWDNSAKIAQLERFVNSLAAQLQAIEKELTANNQAQIKLDQLKQMLRDFLNFESFSDLDWQGDQRLYEDLKAQKTDLSASSDADQVRMLQAQYAEKVDQLKNIQSSLARIQAVISTRENSLASHSHTVKGLDAQLVTLPDDLEQFAPRIKADQKGKTLTLANVDDMLRQAERYYQQSRSSYTGYLNTTRDTLFSQIADFKHAFPTDTEDIDRSLAALPDLRRMHEQIQKDDLPRYQKRFQKMLDEKIIQDISLFQKALDQRVEEYKERIAGLNRSLRELDFSDSTYIQIDARPTRDDEVRKFKVRLRECYADVGQNTPDANEVAFQRIKALIEDFQEDERWTNKITDVRNWLEFAAPERYRSDDSQKEYHDGSAGKSGGQKAKLAYTIMASAIAYQYGLSIDEDKAKTFRFVIVDEAFSKSDERNSRYAMELFEQLGLQLLVVAQVDKIHVAEPYIGMCHYVANNAEENDSKVVDFTLEQYRQRREAIRTNTLVV